MKILDIIFQSNGTICRMDDESTWSRDKEGIWRKESLSKEELQKEVDSRTWDDNRPWKA